MNPQLEAWRVRELHDLWKQRPVVNFIDECPRERGEGWRAVLEFGDLRQFQGSGKHRLNAGTSKQISGGLLV